MSWYPEDKLSSTVLQDYRAVDSLVKHLCVKQKAIKAEQTPESLLQNKNSRIRNIIIFPISRNSLQFRASRRASRLSVELGFSALDSRKCIVGLACTTTTARHRFGLASCFYKHIYNYYI